ncbi:hypothetical protein BDW02DRAFT_584585 [Decorospora gaudefroyi]|uniref:Uncharacterized protein n=1 Tax=Decorospora gaudefroyi TaxID=184978 RepID=A0A6A5K1B7_9PLEO|nr:hypothetical protein BDW02DRAFT_584585 [Decorospora gaudefroyi]
MLEMRIPDRAWMHWRKRMWRSSAYAIVCFALYVSVGALYRFAFSVEEHITIAGGRQCSYALMGNICGERNLFGFYRSLIDQGASLPTYAAPSLSFIRGSPGDWDIQASWHGQTFAADTEPKTWGWLKAWHVLGITLLDDTDSAGGGDEEFSYLLDGTSLRVAEHPVCGPMLRGATTNGTKSGGPASREYWFGLAIGEMKTTDYHGYSIGGVQSKWSFLAEKRTVFAVLLSILQHNQTYISQPNRAQLIEKDLLRQEFLNPERDYCECSYSPGLEYSKHTSVTIYAFPRTQFFASLLAIVWGVLLLAAAYPFRRLVIRGTLDQHMSFGGDIGSESMAGASTGKFSATSSGLWQLSRLSKKMV